MKNSDKDNKKNLNSIEYIKERKKIQKERIEKLEKKLDPFNKLVKSFKLPESVTKMIEQNNKLLSLTPKASHLSSFQKFNEIAESFKFPESVTKIIEQNNRLLSLTPKTSHLSSFQKFNEITKSFKLPESVTKIIEQNNRLLSLTPKASHLGSFQKFNEIAESFKLPESVTKIIEQNNRLLSLTPKASHLSSFHSLNKALEPIAYSRDIIKILDEEIDNVVSNNKANRHSSTDITMSIDEVFRDSKFVENLNKFIKESNDLKNSNDRIDELTKSIEKIYEISEKQPTMIKQIILNLMNKCVIPIVNALLISTMLSSPLAIELKGSIWGQKNIIKKNSVKKAYVKASNLNIRNDSSIEGIVIGKLKKNTVIKPITEVNGWILIEYVGRGVPPMKEFGWINKKYLTYFN